MAEVADHIAVAEWWTPGALTSPTPSGKTRREYPWDPAAKLCRHPRRRAAFFLMKWPRLHPSRRARQFVKNGETWTGRKVPRRMIWHEIHHYKLLLPYRPPQGTIESHSRGGNSPGPSCSKPDKSASGNRACKSAMSFNSPARKILLALFLPILGRASSCSRKPG